MLATETTYQYETCCVNSTAELIHAMQDEAVDVTYATLRKHCEGFDEWVKDMGYDRDARLGLTIRNDWHVSYHKSKYDGKPCYFVQHSHIEHIWTKENENE